MDVSTVNIVITSVVGSSTVIMVFILGRILGYAKKIQDSINKLTLKTTVQDVKIEVLLKDKDNQNERLNRHSNRIMDAEKRILILVDKLTTS